MKKSILASVLLVLSFVAQAQFSLQNLQVEYQKASLGLDEAHPRFSWQMNSSARNAKQSAYRLVVQTESGQIVWDSKKQNTNISLGIQYAGEALQAKTAYRWTLEVWDSAKKKSTQNSHFETGLMNPGFDAWKGAEWIGSNDLTQLTLGVDRDSEIVAFDFDERDPGMLEMLRMAVAGAKRNHRHIGICGEAPAGVTWPRGVR